MKKVSKMKLKSIIVVLLLAVGCNGSYINDLINRTVTAIWPKMPGKMSLNIFFLKLMKNIQQQIQI